MGAYCTSGDFYERNPDLKKYRNQFCNLQFSEKDIAVLHKVFRKVDVDGSGTIGLTELLFHLQLENSTFTRRIFTMFDEDNSGQIDFSEFVLSVWNYCTLTKGTLPSFAFELYDRDGSGEITPGEVKRMLKELYGPSYNSNVRAKAIETFLTENDDGYTKDVTIAAFHSLAVTHPALLFPAFQLQDTLRRRILGARFWKGFADRRLELSHGEYISIGKMMDKIHSKDEKQVFMQEKREIEIIQGVRSTISAKQKTALEKKEEEVKQKLAWSQKDRGPGSSPDAVSSLVSEQLDQINDTLAGPSSSTSMSAYAASAKVAKRLNSRKASGDLPNANSLLESNGGGATKLAGSGTAPASTNTSKKQPDSNKAFSAENGGGGTDNSGKSSLSASSQLEDLEQDQTKQTHGSNNPRIRRRSTGVVAAGTAVAAAASGRRRASAVVYPSQ